MKNGNGVFHDVCAKERKDVANMNSRLEELLNSLQKKEEENYCVQPEKCMEIPICRLRYIRDFEIYMGIYMNQRNNYPDCRHAF